MREESFRAGDLSDKAKKRGWREVEAWRERKFLRESLAEIWDDDPMIDESVFSVDDSDVTFYTETEDAEVEEELSDFDDEAFYDEED
jgi:hypothetical protein